MQRVSINMGNSAPPELSRSWIAHSPPDPNYQPLWESLIELRCSNTRLPAHHAVPYSSFPPHFKGARRIGASIGPASTDVPHRALKESSGRGCFDPIRTLAEYPVKRLVPEAVSVSKCAIFKDPESYHSVMSFVRPDNLC